VADIGDLAINTFSLSESIRIISESYDAILKHDVVPAAMGGDHSITLPILRAIARRQGPVALVHVDAHADVNDEMFGERETHGTVFRRAHEEGLIVADKTYQIGLRGTGYGADDFAEARGWGFQQFPAHELWHRSLADLGAEIRRDIGGRPVYVSFDIDSLDPAFAPGTGTPEIGGLTVVQALELIRALRGANIVGFDLVEVSPPYDPSGNTALTAANLMYELLCVVAGRGEK
jgi:guanidinobutyrase